LSSAARLRSLGALLFTHAALRPLLRLQPLRSASAFFLRLRLLRTPAVRFFLLLLLGLVLLVTASLGLLLLGLPFSVWPSAPVF